MESISKENESGESKMTEPQQQPSKRRNLTIPLFAVLILLLGVGIWAASLKFTLGGTQQQLSALQSDYAKLEGENKQLVEELALANADLEKAQKDLVTAKADLKKAKDEGKKLKAKMDLASKTAEILDAFFNVDKAMDFFELSTMIQATRDQELIKQWDAYRSDSSSEGTFDLVLYMVGSIRNELK